MVLVTVSVLDSLFEDGMVANELGIYKDEFLYELMQCLVSSEGALTQTELFSKELCERLGLNLDNSISDNIQQWVKSMASILYATLNEQQLYLDGVAPYELFNIRPGVFLLVKMTFRKKQLNKELNAL